LVSALLKVRHHPHVSALTRTDRVALSLAAWPTMWMLQLAQSGVSVAVGGADSTCAAIVHFVMELRALELDPNEWSLVESIIIAGKGRGHPYAAFKIVLTLSNTPNM
jgi:hypothetical protein